MARRAGDAHDARRQYWERNRVLDDLDRLEAAMSRELAPERLWFTLPEGIAWTL